MTAANLLVSRRDLMIAAGGLVVGIPYATLSGAAHAADVPAHLPGGLTSTPMLSAWLRVNPNGTVTVFTGKVEFGQGIASALEIGRAHV